MWRWKLGKGGSGQQPYNETDGKYESPDVSVGGKTVSSFEDYRDAVLDMNGFSDQYREMTQQQKDEVDEYLKGEYHNALDAAMKELNNQELGGSGVKFYGDDYEGMVRELLPKILTKDLIDNIEKTADYGFRIISNNVTGYTADAVSTYIQRARFGTSNFSTCSFDEFNEIESNMPHIDYRSKISEDDIKALIDSGVDFPLYRGIKNTNEDDSLQGFYDKNITKSLIGEGLYGHVIYMSFSRNYSNKYAENGILVGGIVRNGGNLKVLYAANQYGMNDIDVSYKINLSMATVTSTVEKAVSEAGYDLKSEEGLALAKAITRSVTVDAGVVGMLLGYDALYGKKDQFDILNPNIVDIVPVALARAE